MSLIPTITADNPIVISTTKEFTVYVMPIVVAILNAQRAKDRARLAAIRSDAMLCADELHSHRLASQAKRVRQRLHELLYNGLTDDEDQSVEG